MQETDRCPKCKVNNLTDALYRGDSYIICSKMNCPYNFRDRRCPTCSAEVKTVEIPAMGEFDFTCIGSHAWHEGPNGMVLLK